MTKVLRKIAAERRVITTESYQNYLLPGIKWHWRREPSCVTRTVRISSGVRSVLLTPPPSLTSPLQISNLKSQLNVYKPLLLALVTTLVCIAIWLLVLTLTGKRRDKLRRLLRRDMFITEMGTEFGDSQVRQD